MQYTFRKSPSVSILFFLCQVQEFGLSEIRDLIPNGRHIAVTEENKKEYVKLVCQMKMTGAIRKQIDSFLEGFYEIIPKRLISIFDEQELELLISGLPNIDLDDLKANTEYHKYTENSLQVGGAFSSRDRIGRRFISCNIFWGKISDALAILPF